MITKENKMKTTLKLLLTLLLLGILTGCQNGSTTQDPVADSPILQPEETLDAETPTPIPAVVVKPSGWYMRTVTTASLPDGTIIVHKSAGVFGQLDESTEGKDRHDIESYGKAVLQAVFVNDKIDSEKTYFSDYRAYEENGKEVWTFQVKNQQTTDLSNAAIHFAVKGPYIVYKNTKETRPRYIEKASKDESKKRALTLVDVDNQRTYSYDELKTANLNMDGEHTRTFRWILGDVDNADMEPLQKITYSKSLRSFSAKSTVNDFSPVIENDSKFGMPPE